MGDVGGIEGFCTLLLEMGKGWEDKLFLHVAIAAVSAFSSSCFSVYNFQLNVCKMDNVFFLVIPWDGCEFK